MISGMATKPVSTTKVYLITAQSPTTATLSQGKNTITWEALSGSGQTTVIVPAGAKLTLSNPDALLSPLPFEAALAVGNNVSGGSSVVPAGYTPSLVEAEAPTLELAHEAWFELNAATLSCTLIPSVSAKVLQTHLIITPAGLMPTGWLTAADGAVVRWPFGEVAMPTGWSYIVTLVQVGNVILANAMPVDLSTPTA